MDLAFPVLFLCRLAALAACVVSSGPAACGGGLVPGPGRGWGCRWTRQGGRGSGKTGGLAGDGIGYILPIPHTLKRGGTEKGVGEFLKIEV